MGNRGEKKKKKKRGRLAYIDPDIDEELDKTYQIQKKNKKKKKRKEKMEKEHQTYLDAISTSNQEESEEDGEQKGSETEEVTVVEIESITTPDEVTTNSGRTETPTMDTDTTIQKNPLLLNDEEIWKEIREPKNLFQTDDEAEETGGDYIQTKKKLRRNYLDLVGKLQKTQQEIYDMRKSINHANKDEIDELLKIFREDQRQMLIITDQLQELAIKNKEVNSESDEEGDTGEDSPSEEQTRIAIDTSKTPINVGDY